MEATNKPSKANDYAVAHAMNREIFSTFVMVYAGYTMDISEYYEIPNLNRAYILLVDELQKIYARNPELQSIKPDPLWKRFEVLKNHTEEIFDYVSDTENWGHEHIAKVEKLCIIAGVEDPIYTPEQQKLIDNLDANRKEYASKIKELMEKSEKDIQIPSYNLTFKLDGSILINDVFRLKRVHVASSTERLLEQALKSPNTLFKPDIGQTSRNLSTVLSSAGFTRELRQLFFPTVSNNKGIVFRPTISRQQADEENIDTTELDAKLYALGAKTEPKST